ncbi:ER-golgi trafficking TRAPP I complex 85 kDa subunit-domain-containing protein [Mycena latifolia]|nr:ER-golgi trafficking TRAPP I complex 85 kDa subunit-domain-containing protein [Mycena latifolia]
MAPALPSSLSPHICIVSSPDLTELLKSSLLPPLPHILQSFSPLPQVTTRTTSLTSVPHASFGLRFSSLSEIESACREDEEQRAERTIDWIGARINKRSSKWLEDMEKLGEKDSTRTPWWDELKRCAEGDHVPSKTEGWNHPVATITALHSRVIELPSWVDPTFLRYTLIVHPQNSPFSAEEAGALFNAVKKQFGLHSYLLPLGLPNPPPPPVPVPALIPRLPPPPSSDSPELSPTAPPPTPSVPASGALNTLRMSETDIQQTARFTREFLVMSLVPWMEKCVVEWNENVPPFKIYLLVPLTRTGQFSSNRRLPSRLFSSTRRLFGSPSPSPAPTHASTPSLSRSTTLTGSSLVSGASTPAPPSQQRRLAEFATILGDFKLAVTVWESMRKEGKGGSEMLPLLLSPSPAIPLHVANALSSISPSTSELTAQAQLRALSYAVRWEIGIGSTDFIGSALDGDRWLVWAAGNTEEPPSALLLAHAALLSARKSARRRAALWYLSAANRLEKCGIKPLTMYFLRKAHGLYKMHPQKELSPSFWDSEGHSPSNEDGFDAILSGIEHPLGRLLYTTGDVAGAVRFFLGLLRGSSLPPPPLTNGNATVDNFPGTDKVFLDDFRVAFAHFKSTAGDQVQSLDLKLPFTFCLQSQTRLRLPRDSQENGGVDWQSREEDWMKFWKGRGRTESLTKAGKVAVDETFYVDLVMRNPLDAEVNLSNLTVVVQDSHSENGSTSQSFLDVEVVQDVILGPRQSRTVPIAVKSTRPTSLTITQAAYEFLSLLPSTESLASRGRRLHNTPAQRQHPTYAPDVLHKVDIVEATHKLLVNFVDDQGPIMGEGESKSWRLWFANRGTKAIGEMWMVAGADDELWVSTEPNDDAEISRSDNSLTFPQPYRIPIGEDSTALQPGDSTEVPVIIHAGRIGEQELSLLFVYRESDTDSFHSTRVTRSYDVRPILDITASALPCNNPDYLFMMNIELENVSGSHPIHLEQVTTLSPIWRCDPLAEPDFGSLAPSQSSRLFFGASHWMDGTGSAETFDFVARKLKDVLHGTSVETSSPPPIDIMYNHISKSRTNRSAQAATRHFIHRGRRNSMFRQLARTHPHIPAHSYPSIFPLHNPNSVDVIIFWEIPTQHRRGHILLSGITLGAGHAALKDIIDEAEAAKVKRSMYAETQRQKLEVLDAIRNSEWNMEMNPVVVMQEEAPVLHDFSTGPSPVPVTFTLRNYSLTHQSRFVLRLASDSDSCPPDVLPPAYTGRLTFRGTLKPLESTRITPKIWVVCPGTYALSGWRLETEVLETTGDGDDVTVRHRYREESPLGSSITVSDTR